MLKFYLILVSSIAGSSLGSVYGVLSKCCCSRCRELVCAAFFALSTAICIYLYILRYKCLYLCLCMYIHSKFLLSLLKCSTTQLNVVFSNEFLGKKQMMFIVVMARACLWKYADRQSNVQWWVTWVKQGYYSIESKSQRNEIDYLCMCICVSVCMYKKINICKCYAI